MANTTETNKRPVKIGFAVHVEEKYDREPWIEVAAQWATSHPGMLTQTEKPFYKCIVGNPDFKIIWMDPKPAKDAQ